MDRKARSNNKRRSRLLIEANRVTQHKSRREEAKGRELSEIKQENRQLKRQLERLRKQLLKALDQGPRVPEEVVETLAGPAKALVLECSECKRSPVNTVTLPTGILLVCPSCGFKKKKTPGA